jgi:CelD/BcsL family acetyltransferase involved in cellulose biosynthesis
MTIAAGLTASWNVAGAAARTGATIVSDYAHFVALEPEWNAAVDKAGVPYPFLRHEWIRTWWDCFGHGAQLHIVVVRDGDRIVGIAPLMRESAQMYGVPVRRLRMVHNDHTPRMDFVVAGDHRDVCGAVWTALRQARTTWDVLQLSQLPRDSRTATVMTELAAGDGCQWGAWASNDSPYLPLEGDWDSYLSSLPAKFRSNLRNRLGRLAKLGEPRLEVIRDRRGIEQAAADAWRLEASGWKNQAGTAITCDPSVHRFYTRLIERGAAAGWLELLFLRVGDRRVATSFGAAYDGRLFLFKTGYDPEYAAGAPFKVLTCLAVQDAYARGLREVDFLGDAEPWKLEWTSRSRQHDWLFIFADSVRGRLLRTIKFGPLRELKRWRA